MFTFFLQNKYDEAFGTRYSRVDQIKYVKTAFKMFQKLWSVYHYKFIKAVF